MNKIALITGANKGIGLEIARQLARDESFTVLLGARDEARGQAAAQQLQGEGLDVQFVPLLVTDAASIQNAARWVEERFGVLDVLINNAGIAKDSGAPSSTSLETLRETYETNVFGPVAVIEAFLPLLRKSGAGRIVNMSSELAIASRCPQTCGHGPVETGTESPDVSASRQPLNPTQGIVVLKLKIIIGSTRTGRNADSVYRWLLPLIQASGAFEVETLDLRDWPLPFFQETIATVGEFSNPTYSDPLVKHWNERIADGDAFIIVTPEYNRSIPAVLKNAIDSVFFSFRFRQKAVAFVGYSLGSTAAARAVEHLTQIMVETEAVPVRTSTLVPSVTNAFDSTGIPKDSGLQVTFNAMLDDLAWMGNALKVARAAGQLAPASLRIRAAYGRK